MTLIPFHDEREKRRELRNKRIAEGIQRGLSYAQIGRELLGGVSGPAVAQAVKSSSVLRRLARSHTREADLTRIVHEAGLISAELTSMRRELTKIVQAATEELEAIATDRLLGL